MVSDIYTNDIARPIFAEIKDDKLSLYLGSNIKSNEIYVNKDGITPACYIGNISYWGVNERDEFQEYCKNNYDGGDLTNIRYYFINEIIKNIDLSDIERRIIDFCKSNGYDIIFTSDIEGSFLNNRMYEDYVLELEQLGYDGLFSDNFDVMPFDDDIEIYIYKRYFGDFLFIMSNKQPTNIKQLFDYVHKTYPNVVLINVRTNRNDYIYYYFKESNNIKLYKKINKDLLVRCIDFSRDDYEHIRENNKYLIYSFDDFIKNILKDGMTFDIAIVFANKYFNKLKKL